MNITEKIEDRSTNIYLFSYHAPDPKLLEDLGGKITTRFKGTISNIRRQGNMIAFTEALFLGGQELKCCHSIPAKSIVVVEDPILQQDAWLKAGVGTLLVPQMQQERGRWGSTVEKYRGLVQVHDISVSTSVWHGCTPCSKEQIQQPADSQENQQTQVTNDRKMQNKSNLFRLLRWNQAKPVVFH